MGEVLKYEAFFGTLFFMNPEERKLLEETYELVKENNSILRGMRRSAQLQTAMKILYWAVILITAYYSYVLIQPYLNMVQGLNDKAQSSLDTIQNYGNMLQGL